jgi:Tol biopolymer transport system component/DNA-binding winged helix-turn-helix (wHTH) protein
MADLRPFTLHARRVDPSLNRITTASGETVQIEPKVMQVLVALAERPGDVVTRDELMARVWNGVFVTDDALHRAIRELRRVFDDEADAPTVIETIRKRGYRLIAPVGAAENPPAAQRSASPPSRRRLELIPTFAVVTIAAIAVTGWLGLDRRGAPASESSSDAGLRFIPLTSDPGNEIDPALSPSGRLAYVARGDDGRAHVFTKVSPDAVALQVTRGESTDHAPAWAPDETRIAFVRLDAQGCAIWIAAADGREARALTPCAALDEFRMSWSPDGRLLAVTSGATTPRAPSHIELIDIARGDRRRVTTPPPAHSGDWSPAFSPDGSSIAFIRSIGGSIADVFVTPLSSGAPARVTFDNADVLGVDWEPDGRHLVFSSDRAGGISVWRVAITGGEPVLLAGGGAKLKHPTVARQTGMVAYEDWQYEINLRDQSTVANESDAVPISPTGDRWNFHPQISPDGRRLVFQSTRSGQYELWLSDRDGSHPRALTRSAAYKSPARWSPDGTRVAFVTRAGARSDLTLLQVDEGSSRTLISDTPAIVAPAWSANGNSIYFGSLRTGDWQIWNVDVATGRVRQVTADGGYAATESPDGESLYVARLDGRGLYRRSIAGGPGDNETLVAERILAEQWPNWGLYDRGLYYVTWPDDGDPCVALIETGTITPRLLARLHEYAWTGVAVTRDASRVIYAHADRRAANIGAVIRTAAPPSDRSSSREAPARSSREAPRSTERTARR